MVTADGVAVAVGALANIGESDAVTFATPGKTLATTGAIGAEAVCGSGSGYSDLGAMVSTCIGFSDSGSGYFGSGTQGAGSGSAGSTGSDLAGATRTGGSAFCHATANAFYRKLA